MINPNENVAINNTISSEDADVTLLDQVLANTVAAQPAPAPSLLDMLLAQSVAQRPAPAPAPAPAEKPYMAMPFGKHAGKPINKIPASYLNWLLSIRTNPNLRADVRRALGLKDAPPAPVVNATVATPVPYGYRRIAAGKTRQIRVNREWIAQGKGKPTIVVENGVETQYDEVIVEGTSKMVASMSGGCGVALSERKKSAYIETTGSLLVR